MNKSSLDPSLKLRHQKKLRPINKKILFLILLVSSCLLKNENVKAMGSPQLTTEEHTILLINSMTPNLNLKKQNLTQNKFLAIILFLLKHTDSKNRLTDLDISFNPEIKALPNKILLFGNLKTLDVSGTHIPYRDRNLQRLIGKGVRIIDNGPEIV